MEDRSKNSMLKAIKQLTANIPEEAFRTFTSDRGKEFSCWEEVEKMGIEFYFADPYCSWQRGCNENSNGLLREFYPKKTDISKVDTEDLIRTLMLINSRECPEFCVNSKYNIWYRMVVLSSCFFKFFLQNKYLTGSIFLPSLISFQSISLLLPSSLNILISLTLHL